jgi:hypothetical protein
MKTECKKWWHAVAAYNIKELRGKCDTCLYRDDKPCPFDKQFKTEDKTK